jgi:hypothetical protein
MMAFPRPLLLPVGSTIVSLIDPFQIARQMTGIFLFEYQHRIPA